MLYRRLQFKQIRLNCFGVKAEQTKRAPNQHTSFMQNNTKRLTINFNCVRIRSSVFTITFNKRYAMVYVRYSYANRNVHQVYAILI